MRKRNQDEGESSLVLSHHRNKTNKMERRRGRTREMKILSTSATVGFSSSLLFRLG